MSIGKRKWIAAAAAVALTLTVSVSAAFALDTTDQAFERIRVVYEVVSTWHKDGADLDKFTSGAIKGGLEALGDQYTQYFTPDDYKSFMDSLNGSFSGIGAYLEQVGDYVVISAPIKNSPAAKADLQAGDRIVEANGTNLVGATADKAVEIIRGEPGTQVTLKIERPSANRTFTVTITRQTISVPEVDSKLLEPGVGYIELSSFGDDAAKDFYKAMESLKAQGAKAVVLDLRNNGGGYVDAALAVASAWTPLNKPVAWEVRKNSKTSLDSKGYTVTMPVVTLVNKGTASASEIVAGAIQDYKGGPLVGEQTFGKGTVQQILELTMGGGIKVTIAEWLTPNERHINGKGLTPDYVVPMPKPNEERTAPMQYKKLILQGDVSLDVLYLQYRLQDLGYEVETNGFWGLKTTQSVIKFNRDNNLPAEALVNEKTMEALNNRVAERLKSLKQEDPQLKKAVELAREQLKKN